MTCQRKIHITIDSLAVIAKSQLYTEGLQSFHKAQKACTDKLSKRVQIYLTTDAVKELATTKGLVSKAFKELIRECAKDIKHNPSVYSTNEHGFPWKIEPKFCDSLFMVSDSLNNIIADNLSEIAAEAMVIGAEKIRDEDSEL